MNILLLASTQREIQETIDYLDATWEKKSFWEHSKEGVTVTNVVTGIGSILAAFKLARQANLGTFNYVINPGVGFALSRTLDLGKVYLIESEMMADVGLEELDGSFHNLHDLGWYDPNKFPFVKGKLYPKKRINPTYLPACNSITLNKIPGTSDAIEHLQRKYHVDLITQEGAAIMYACRMLDLELVQYRVTRRFIEPWQKQPIQAPNSIRLLNQATIEIIESLYEDSEHLKKLSVFR